jgi:hypothetical protein
MSDTIFTWANVLIASILVGAALLGLFLAWLLRQRSGSVFSDGAHEAEELKRASGRQAPQPSIPPTDDVKRFFSVYAENIEPDGRT